MNELAGIIRTTEKDRQKYIKQLLEVKEDPVRAIQKSKRLKKHHAHSQHTGVVRSHGFPAIH